MTVIEIKPHRLESLCYGLIVNVFALDVPPPGGGVTTLTKAVPAVSMSDEGTVAVSRVLLTKVVVKAELFQCTFEPETKCDPLTVSVKPGPSAVALLGEIELIAGTGLLTVNGFAFDVPPPGEAFTTLTKAVPAVSISDSGTEAVSRVLLTKVVVKTEPFQCTLELETKCDPVTVRVKPGPSAVALLGEIELMAGTGLLTVNDLAFDVPPPGGAFTTLTNAVPAVSMSDSGTVAVSRVLLTKVVVKTEPFQCTFERETKCDPVTVRVKAGPSAVALLGEIELIAGTGLLTVNVFAFDVPPPGPGFVTVTLIVPAVAMSAAEIAAVSWALLENVVVRGAPFQFTTEVVMNPDPFTVSVKAAPPAVTLAGEMEVTVGTPTNAYRTDSVMLSEPLSEPLP